MAQSPRIRTDPASSVPVVRQIVDSLRVLLVEGQLPPGTALPSVRRVAMELRVHFNTVAEAYRQLAAEGWLELKHGRSAVVVERTAPRPRGQAWAERFRTRLRALAAELQAEGVPPEDIASELRAIANVVAP